MPSYPRSQFEIILESTKKMNESEDEFPEYKKAAKKMIQVIKDKSPDWEDEDGSVEKSFYENMVKMKKGEL